MPVIIDYQDPGAIASALRTQNVQPSGAFNQQPPLPNYRIPRDPLVKKYSDQPDPSGDNGEYVYTTADGAGVHVTRAQQELLNAIDTDQSSDEDTKAARRNAILGIPNLQSTPLPDGSTAPLTPQQAAGTARSNVQLQQGQQRIQQGQDRLDLMDTKLQQSDEQFKTRTNNTLQHWQDLKAQTDQKALQVISSQQDKSQQQQVALQDKANLDVVTAATRKAGAALTLYSSAVQQLSNLRTNFAPADQVKAAESLVQQRAEDLKSYSAATEQAHADRQTYLQKVIDDHAQSILDGEDSGEPQAGTWSTPGQAPASAAPAAAGPPATAPAPAAPAATTKPARTVADASMAPPEDLPDAASLPRGKVIMDKRTGRKFINMGNKWVEQSE